MAPGDVRAFPLHVVAIVVLVLGCVFAVWRLAYPTECAWVAPSSSAWTAAGVRPDVPRDCQLTPGQIVTGASVRADSVTLTVEDGSRVTLPRNAPGTVVAQRIGRSASSFAFVVALFALAVHSVRRRPRATAPAALAVFAGGLLGSTLATMTGLPVSAAFGGAARWLWFANVQAAFLLCWGGLIAALLHFPTPPPTPTPVKVGATLSLTRLTWLALLGPTALWLVAILAAALRGPSFTGWVRTSVVVQSSLTVLVILAALTMLGMKVRRALRSDPADVARQQVLWVAGSAVVSASLTLGIWMVPELLTGEPLLPNDLIGAPGLVSVAGLTVTMLRYRLFDLDVVLTRTIVYSLLLLTAVATYLLVTAALAAAFGAVADGPIAVVGAVVVALGTNPLRVRLARLVNRTFYGDRHEPYVALSRIAEQVADRNRSLTSLAEDIRRSLRVPYLEIAPEGGSPVGSGNPESRANGVVDLPTAWSGDVVGRVVLARRGRDERFSRTEHRLLDDIARELGSRLRADRMALELQRSRERIVTAREEERRALRRTLHDDIGPTMAAMALKAETARRALADPTTTNDTRGLLGDIARTAARSAESLRSLAYDLRPPALDELGLVEAVRLIADSAPGPLVDVVVDGLDDPAQAPLGAATEAAAYRIVRSAIDNATRHAEATTCRVRLAREADRLVVVVEDDGVGMPSAHRRGVGLTSMAERAAELGGTCTIGTRPQGGTVVRAELPTTAPSAPTASRP
ncbi:histidine kinase [Knoellia locipacati]|uniref:sensor histidine kinase n=1 Tax=Knoellia locipacati TaxID=882824 RepID=UPI00384F5F12